MKKEYKEIIQILLDNSIPVNSTYIAKKIGVSSRSVKQFIQEINQNKEPKMIVPTKTGYLINRQLGKKNLKNGSEFPQTYEERSQFLVKHLLMGEKNNNFFDICDLLFVSFSTLKNDIVRMNETFSEFSVGFEIKNDILFITGEEQAKRKLVSHILSSEINGNFMNIGLLKKSFSEQTIDTLIETLQLSFQKYAYSVNDFAYSNIITHLAIIVERISTGNSSALAADMDKLSDKNNELVAYIGELLSKKLRIKLNSRDYFEIHTLISSNSDLGLSTSNEELKRIVSPQIVLFAEKIIQKVKESYFINLNNSSFLIPFVIHLNNMLIRIRSGKILKNPMLQNIKTSCPSIYDIAVFISINMMNEFNIIIDENEIAFITLHIGGELEHQTLNQNKVNCVIFCPEYHNLQKNIYNEISSNFKNQLNIIKVVNFESELDSLEFELLITTLNLQKIGDYEMVVIPPFSSGKELSEIPNAVYKIKNKQKFKVLQDQFSHYLNQETFFIADKNAKKEEVILTLFSKMKNLGYVGEEFLVNVFEREAAGSTAFSKIAIPHSVLYEASRTNIAVAISTDGIGWEKNIVHIVFLIAMNKSDSVIFKELYEALVILFNDDLIINYAKECSTFNDFRNLIYSCISRYLE